MGTNTPPTEKQNKDKMQEKRLESSHSRVNLGTLRFFFVEGEGGDRKGMEKTESTKNEGV